MFRQPSILRNVFLGFIALGLVMGSIFPVYAGFFVDWKPGLKGWFIFGCLVAGLFVGLFNFLLLRMLLLIPMSKIATVADQIGNKDITHRCEMKSHDMVGRIIDSFNRMAENLRQMLGQISQTTHSLNLTADNLQAITSATEEDAHHQQTGTREIATAIDHMRRSLDEMRNDASNADEAAQHAEQACHKGSQEIQTSAKAISRLSQELEHSGQVIRELREQSNNIGTVLDVISGIAEQTNLLALNAAIEAARAGEQGRGFAVVADEVRTLATRTHQSTTEIQTMIANLQSQAENAVKVMDGSRHLVHSNVEQSEVVAEALNAIAEGVETIRVRNSGILDKARDSQQQAEHIQDNIQQITGISERTANSTVKSSQECSRFTQLTKELDNLVSGFKT